MAANQGSRAGLITTVVILSIVSVVAVIFAFWFGAEKRNVDRDIKDLRATYSDLISGTALSGQEVADLKSLRQDPASGYTKDTKVWDIVTGQRDQLIKTVTGKDATRSNNAQSALKAVKDKLAAINADEAIQNANLSLASTNDDLLGAVDLLADKVRVQVQTIADRDAKLAEANKRAEDAIKQKDEDLKARDEEVAKVRAEAEEAIRGASEDRSKQGGVLSNVEKARQTERQQLQDAISKAEVENKTLSQKVAQLQSQVAMAQQKFDRFRVDTSSPMLRSSDAVVSSITSKDLVYINLGQGRGIVPGMTFEVYDRGRGIPKLGQEAPEGEQPAGKASIEVIRILSDSSECRVTRLALGQQIMQGDLVMNVVYDPNRKYNFFVFGRFDLDRNGVATAQDTEVVKRLIGQWGGNVVNKITVDTDFIVVGPEPVLPNYNQEELTDPINLKKQTDAQAELDEFLNVIGQARELRIPILNQNRFLYLTGQEDVVSK